MSLEGKIIDNRYEVLLKVGGGGMATVYKAKDNMLVRTVALKVLRQEFNDDKDFVKRFKIEAQSAASLSHQNIVSVFDVGSYENNYYIVMEYIEGPTLKEYIQKKGTLGWPETLKIAGQIASALVHAHKHHIIHRDIKPHNILITEDLTAKVTDFGIAKVSSSSTINTIADTIGSVHYFSPEHARGGYMDEKSDIYSLGVVMYEMLTGRVPFDADSPVTVAMKHIQDEPIPPVDLNSNIPSAINLVVLKAMAKNPIYRYITAGELLKDINNAVKTPDGEFVEIHEEVIKPFIAGSTQKIPLLRQDNIEEKKRKRILIRNSLLNKLDENLELKDLDTKNKNIDSILDKERKKELTERDNETLSERDKAKQSINNQKEIDRNIKKIVLPVAIAIGIIAIITISIFVVPTLFKVFGKSTTIMKSAPNLVGRNFDEVKVELAKEGIELLNTGNQYDNTGKVPEGSILIQNPETGITLKSKRIEVIVSKGIKKVVVPDLTNTDYKVAAYQLDNLELKYELDYVISTEIVENFIIKQDIKANTEVPVGTTIKITISKGNGKIRNTMPKITGMSEKDARTKIQELKLILTNVTYVKDTSQPDDTVILQSIPANTQVEESSVITININRLPKTKNVVVNLSGLGIDDTTKFNLKVTAELDGIESQVYIGQHARSEGSVNVSVIGYITAIIRVYVDDKVVSDKQQTITF